MKHTIKVTLLDEDSEKFFGDGPLRLLRAVEQTGSLRGAAVSMGMAYSKAMKLIRQAESVLGFALTARTAGGRDGGGSCLTEEGKRWLARYEAYRADCLEACNEVYRRHFPRTGCVIMASGQGRRFGGNKLLADFRGEPMICAILETTRGLFDARVVVTRHREVAALCEQKSIPVVLHDLPHRSDTVRLGLEALGDDVECCMFCPADQPLLRRETIATLMEHRRSDPEAIWRTCCDGTPGSPVLFPGWTFPALISLPEGKGGSAVLAAHPDLVRMVPVTDPYELTDADTPEELEMLRRIAHDQEN